MSPLRRTLLGLLICGCSEATPGPREGTGLGSVAIASSPVDSSRPEPHPADVEAAPLAKDADSPVEEQTEIRFTSGNIDGQTTTATCDFERPYRGKIGDVAATLVFSKKENKLAGAIAYDSGAGELPLRGEVGADNTWSAAEVVGAKTAGVLTGRCDPTTGALTGSWVMKGDPKNLQFKPLPKGSMPILASSTCSCTSRGVWQRAEESDFSSRSVRRGRVLQLRDARGVVEQGDLFGE